MKKRIYISLLIFFMVFCFQGCCDEKPVEEGTMVTSNSTEFAELSRKMNPNLDCKRINCCFMDGIETSCSLVNACLEAGFCKVVATD